MKLRRYTLVPLNFSGRQTVHSRTNGWEEEEVELGANGGCGSVVVCVLICRIEAPVMIPEGFHFRVEVVARLPLLGLGC